MDVVVFHGSPRKGNTYAATQIFLEGLAACGAVRATEFFLPKALPVFCTGCQRCLEGPRENCPHAEYVTPILEAVMAADALVFATPHHGGCSMSGGMKSLLDHLDFLTLTVAPREAMFAKKAFILTTATGSAAAIGPVRKFLKHWGVNRVDAVGLRMFTNRWDAMPGKKQAAFERRLRRAAKRFYEAKRKRPYVSAVGMYYMSRMIIRRYVGPGGYPYEHWMQNGFFQRRPF